MNNERITFRSLREADLPLMLAWLNKPHVSKWYKIYGQEFPFLEDVRKKYLPRINGEEPTACYLIIYGDTPIGHLQSYRIDDYPAHKETVDISQDCAGIDIFIGEEDYINQGLGSPIIKKFLQEIVFTEYDVRGCIIDPDPRNEAAIKCYCKTGFKHLKTIWNSKDGVWAYIMSMNRDEFMPEGKMANRKANIKRKTKETNINLALNIDGTGEWEIKTDVPMFDHLLSQVMHHGRFDLKLTGTGDDPHHLVEDIAICLGRAFNQALGEKRGIIRMGDATVPMDDALAMVAVDFSGRAYSVLDLSFNDNDMRDFSTDLIRHFLETLANEARLTLHARILYGTNDHHRAEALFKALGRALDVATRLDERISGKPPSTKGSLER